MIDTLEYFVSLVNPVHLWVIFALTLVYATTISLILIYHWHNYGTNSKKIIIVESLYIIVITIILITMAITVNLFSSLI